MYNREVPGCPRECSIPSGRAGSNNRRTEEVFLLRVSRTKRSSENSNWKSGSVLVYILTKQSVNSGSAKRE